MHKIYEVRFKIYDVLFTNIDMKHFLMTISCYRLHNYLYL
jgi:hypothetical protein